MRIWDRMFGRKAKALSEEEKNAAAGSEERREAGEPYLTQTVVFGMHLYRRETDDSSVYFVDERRKIRKMLVDAVGNIQNFPGIVEQEFWKKEVSANATNPQICFRTAFERRADRWIMLWQIQPDGRYWEDDGFGMEHESEVTLYTYIDGNGDFTGPFQIYKMGRRPFTLDLYEYALERSYDRELERLKENCLMTERMDEALVFPRLHDTPKYESGENRYALWGLDMAQAYWKHPILSKNLLEATNELLKAEKDIAQIRSSRNIQASMTLFRLITEEPAFQAVLDRFFAGELEPKTVFWLKQWGVHV